MKNTQIGMFLVLMAAAQTASAATTGGTLPWEGPLQTLVTSLTGPVAFAGSAIALTAAFLTLAFSSDLTGFARYLVYLALAVSGLLFILNLLTTVFGAGSSTTSSLIVMQVMATLAYVAICCALACAQLVLWTLARRIWQSMPRYSHSFKVAMNVAA